MNRGIIAVAVLCVGLCLQPPSVYAQQTDSTVVHIELTDGTTIVGHIMAQDSVMMHIQSVSGIDYTLRRDQIASVQTDRGRFRGTRFLRLDPNRTRLAFTPTGRPMEPGQLYVGLYEIFIPFVAYGITHNMGVAGGVSLLPFSTAQLVYFGPKITVLNQEKVSVSGGAIAGSLIGSTRVPIFGLIYGLGTFGSPYRALTLGIAYGFADDELADQPVFMIGGELQIFEQTKLITENYVLPEHGGTIISAGVRFFGERMTFDIVLGTHSDALDEGGFPFLPFISFVRHFGKQ